ncbi:MAG TPA: bifunctional diaminohydroxyphosphoribosylaminopyrimidine deaminase/5-amino-6-(5-phosphoribosylamino)uracil reductase RibD [Chthoniobacterales bacterium]|nr:bifunctional diaminohydroxyphosphoribosylaminopyrimidine deaminase/5-amino-6-(5-phosphoribosylamino)uracil reductase RibD [Chthoniobacterales bacterium]
MTDVGDEIFMRAALDEARQGVGKTSPNPAVGAVLVKKGQIVARGFHRARGSAHAEIECLTNAPKGPLHRATLYVTLEPCSTTGRTPPCTHAIIKTGLGRIVVGATDPNPQHRGRGIEKLRAAGIEVRSGVLETECSRVNEAFNKWIVTGRPFVVAKCGMSLDGRLTRPPEEDHWLTSPAARRHAMQLRSQVDAILIGAETLRQDNPRLTTRGIPGALQPLRVVLTRSGKMPRASHLFSDRWADRTLVYRNKSLARVLTELGQREITSVLIEGGGQILGQAFDSRFVDKVHFYLAPLFTGGPVLAVGGKGVPSTATAARLLNVRHQRVGRDLLVTGYPHWGQEQI